MARSAACEFYFYSCTISGRSNRIGCFFAAAAMEGSYPGAVIIRYNTTLGWEALRGGFWGVRCPPSRTKPFISAAPSEPALAVQRLYKSAVVHPQHCASREQRNWQKVGVGPVRLWRQLTNEKTSHSY
jgi:hypothetical protein